MRSVVVGVSAHERSDPALRWAGELARTRRLSVTAVFVRPLPGAAATWASGVGGEVSDEELAVLFRCADVLDAAGVRWRLETRFGHPSVELTKVARAQRPVAVVVGAGRRSGWQRLRRHRPMLQRLSDAGLPVAVVPVAPPPRPRRLDRDARATVQGERSARNGRS